MIFISLMLCFAMLIPAQVSAASMDTKAFNVEMKVSENNTIDVSETINVTFTGGKHGIYRYIPLKGTVYMKKDGKIHEVDTKMKVSDIDVDGYEYETYTENGNQVIKIGDPDLMLTGDQSYRISYKLTVYDDGFDKFDYFYYNVIPQGRDEDDVLGWETAIDSANVTIEMPKAFDKNDLQVYVGKYGATVESTQKYSFEQSVTGNIINIKINKPLEKGDGVTVQQLLPEGYFVDVKSTSGAGLLSVIVSAVAGILAFVLFLMYGRDKRTVETVEFYPPEGMTSAEVGYVIDGYADDEDLVSLIIYYADKGYLSIEEQGKGRHKYFVLNKLKDLPPEAKMYENIFFNNMFMCGNGQQVTTDTLKDSEFYSDICMAKSQLESYYKDDKKQRIFSGKSTALRLVSGILMIVPMLIAGFMGAREDLNMSTMFLIGSPLLGFLVCGAWAIKTYDRKEAVKASKYRAMTIFSNLLTLICLLLCAWFVYVSLSALAAAVATVMSVLAYIATRQMRSRTAYGNEMLGKLLGFRNFIRVSEVDRLEALVEQDPKYFYSILPYAYVVGLSDKWAKKFKSIAVEPPNWFYGSDYYGAGMFNTVVFMSMLNNCTKSFAATVKIPDSGSGGSSDFGGGGGFGGGGMGGGGGGSW